MYVYADESGVLIRDNVGPALKAAGLDTQIWAYDHNTGGSAGPQNSCFCTHMLIPGVVDVPSYPQTVIDTASEYVNTVAWHVSVPWRYSVAQKSMLI
jgi:glucan endo-1,6-beta-glucosidase